MEGVDIAVAEIGEDDATNRTHDDPQEPPLRSGEKPVSLAPLTFEQALTGLFSVKPPAKPEKPKRKKAALTSEKE